MHLLWATWFSGIYAGSPRGSTRYETRSLSKLAPAQFRTAQRAMLQYAPLYPANALLNLIAGENRNAQRRDYWQWLRWAHRGDLRSTREPQAACSRRPRTGWPALSHHPCREFPRLPGRHPGTRTHREHAEAGAEIRRGVQGRSRDRSRSSQASIQGHRGKTYLRNGSLDRGRRCLGAVAGVEGRKRADWSRSLDLRHLRRLFLSR